MVKGEEERNYTDNNIAFDEIFNYFLFANFKKIFSAIKYQDSRCLRQCWGKKYMLISFQGFQFEIGNGFARWSRKSSSY